MIKDKTSIEAPVVIGEEGHFKRIHVEENDITPSWIVGTETLLTTYSDPNIPVDVLSTNVRGIQVASFALPKGQITKIAIKNGSTGLNNTPCYLAVYEEDSEESTGYKFVACSKNAVAQSSFGATSYTEWEFDPDSIQLTGGLTVRFTFNTDRTALETPSFFGTGSAVCSLDGVGRSLTSNLTYSAASGGKWYAVTPSIMFTVLQNVVATGEPIFRTDKILGSHFVDGVNVNEGILLHGKTCFVADRAMYGIDESDFINNITKYDNVIPTVKMIRLMLQNQSAIAQISSPIHSLSSQELDVTTVSTKTKK